MFDYLLESIPHKLRHAAEGCGLLASYDSGQLQAHEFNSKTGRVKLGIDPEKNGYPGKNVVKDYVPNGLANAPAKRAPDNLDDKYPVLTNGNEAPAAATKAAGSKDGTMHPDIERVALLGWRLTPTTRQRKGMFKGYIDAATADLDTLDRWSSEHPGCNWSCIPESSGVWALDVDVRGQDHDADGVSALQRLIAANSPPPPRPHGRSGGGGHLLVFKDTGAPIRAASGHPAKGLDPKAGRCAFTIAPSIHRNGKPYRLCVAPWELTPPTAPDWLLRAVAPPVSSCGQRCPEVFTTDRAMRRLYRAVHEVDTAGPGTRNDRLNREAYAVGRHVAAGKISESDAFEHLYRAALHTGLDHVEAKATITSGLRASRRKSHDAGATRWLTSSTSIPLARNAPWRNGWPR